MGMGLSKPRYGPPGQPGPLIGKTENGPQGGGGLDRLVFSYDARHPVITAGLVILPSEVFRTGTDRPILSSDRVL